MVVQCNHTTMHRHKISAFFRSACQVMSLTATDPTGSLSVAAMDAIEQGVTVVPLLSAAAAKWLISRSDLAGVAPTA